MALPDPPKNLTATAASSTQINLTWDDCSDNEDGFHVYRTTVSGQTPNLLVGTTAANAVSHQDSGLTPSTTYYYAVAGFIRGQGDGLLSLIASGTTQAGATAPTAPSGLALVQNGLNDITVSWLDNANNEEGFRIEVDTTSSFTAPVTYPDPPLGFPVSPGTGGTAQTNIGGLQQNTVYWLRVYAFNAQGWSSYSASLKVQTEQIGTGGTRPSPPSDLTATAGDLEVALAWTDNANNEQWWQIYGSLDGISYSPLPFPHGYFPFPNKSSHTVTNVPAGVLVYYKVRCGNATGPSEFCLPASATATQPGSGLQPYGGIIKGSKYGFGSSITSGSGASTTIFTGRTAFVIEGVWMSAPSGDLLPQLVVGSSIIFAPSAGRLFVSTKGQRMFIPADSTLKINRVGSGAGTAYWHLTGVFL
jgi:hypothetical protein